MNIQLLLQPNRGVRPLQTSVADSLIARNCASQIWDTSSTYLLPFCSGMDGRLTSPCACLEYHEDRIEVPTNLPPRHAFPKQFLPPKQGNFWGVFNFSPAATSAWACLIEYSKMIAMRMRIFSWRSMICVLILMFGILPMCRVLVVQISLTGVCDVEVFGRQMDIFN